MAMSRGWSWAGFPVSPACRASSSWPGSVLTLAPRPRPCLAARLLLRTGDLGAASADPRPGFLSGLAAAESQGLKMASLESVVMAALPHLQPATDRPR